jgi:ATP adenylyltransferase
VETRCEQLCVAGIPFQIRMLSREPRTPGERPSRPEGDPFLPYEQALHVADIGPDHVCLLNKYPALDDHLLIVTRGFEHQEEALTEGDLRALWSCMAEVPGLGFYNAGEVGGASQPHKHLQLVPFPRGPGSRPPIEAVLAAERPDARGLLPLAGLPYECVVARLELPSSPDQAAPSLLALYRRLLAAVGIPVEPGERPPPYNLLVTPGWMLAAPRTQASFRGIAVNALGYAGSLFVEDAAARDRLLALGPLEVLRQVGVARPRAPGGA